MQTVSISEAGEEFVKLQPTLQGEPVMVLDGNDLLATITPTAVTEIQRRVRWAAFLASSERASAELKRNLDKEGLSVEEFLNDVLRDEP